MHHSTSISSSNWNDGNTEIAIQPESPMLTVKRIQETSDESWNFGGIYYTNEFRTNRDVIMHSLGFFGPFDQQNKPDGMSPTYKVNIILEESGGKIPTVVKVWKGDCIVDSIDKEDEIFYVDFQYNIKAGVWYALRFMLNGPDTKRGRTSELKVVESGVTWDFFDGSRQMPIIRFTKY